MLATSAIDTPTRAGEFTTHPVAANTTIYQGTLVALDVTGQAVPAADAAGLRVVGVACQTYDNSDGAAGATLATVRRGTFLFQNSVTQPLTAADAGKIAVVEDDSTIAASATHRIAAGRFLEISAEYAWVLVGHGALVPAFVPALTSADGEAAGAANLPALAASTEKIGDDLRSLVAALR